MYSGTETGVPAMFPKTMSGSWKWGRIRAKLVYRSEPIILDSARQEYTKRRDRLSRFLTDICGALNITFLDIVEIVLMAIGQLVLHIHQYNFPAQKKHTISTLFCSSNQYNSSKKNLSFYIIFFLQLFFLPKHDFYSTDYTKYNSL